MRLAPLVPSLPGHLAPLVPLLAQVNPSIASTRSLLFTPAPILVKGLLALSQDVRGGCDVSEAALKQLQSIVRAQEAPDFTRGTEAYEDELRVHKKRAGLVAGVGQVDRLLAGIGGCVEISGPDGSGKSLLALHFAVHHLLSSSLARVLWLDTEGSFSAERALEILISVDSSIDPELVLDRLEVRPVFDLASFEHQVLDSLKTRFDSDIVDADGELLMVVDPVTALYGPGLSSNALQTKASMIEDMHFLSDLSRKHALNCLLLNSAAPSTQPHSRLPYSRTKPALGVEWTFLTDACLWVEEWVEGRASAVRKAGVGAGRVTSVEVLRSKTALSGGFATLSTDGIALRNVRT